MIRRLAAAVADGALVDWAEVEHRLPPGTRERDLAASLKALAVLSSPAPVLAGAWPRTAAGVPAWMWPVVALAGLHVLCAVVGVVAGGAGGPVPLLLHAAVVLSFGFAGGALVLGSIADRRAVWLGGVLLAVASAVCHRYALSPALVGALPPAAAGLVQGLLPEALLPTFLWLFVSDFPRVVRLSRRDATHRRLVAAATVTSVLCLAGNTLAALRSPRAPEADPAFGVLARNHDAGLYWVALFVPCALALAFAARRSRDAEVVERRRTAFFLGGLAAGLAPTLAVVLLDFLFPPFARFMATPGGVRASATVAYAFLLVIPVTTTYAVRAHRALRVRGLLHRTARHALARGTILGVVVLPLVALATHLYVNRAQTLTALVSGGQGAALLFLLGGGLAVLACRRPLLRAVDRAFVGSPRNPSRGLAGARASLHAARTFDEGVDVLCAELARRTGAEQPFCLLRSADGGGFAPARGLGRNLAAGSALVALADHDAAIVVDPGTSGSLFALLPEGDRQWIVDTGASVVVPLRRDSGDLRGFLALGRKKSEMPFTTDDCSAAETLCTAAAIALDRLAGGAPPWPAPQEADAPGRECRRCRRVLDGGGAACDCGGETVPAAIPAVLNGKFRLEKVAGRGGMGVVYAARDLSLGRAVALKTLPRLSADLSLRLRQEARAMASLMHPHLALIFGAETWRGVPVLVLEYLAGGTLADRMSGRLAAAEAVAVARDVALALQALHREGLVHRDVKPSNVGFTERGVVKLLDFGLAQLLEPGGGTALGGPVVRPGARAELTPHDRVVGTPLYLSPEALAGRPPSPAQDAWALGLVLHEAIAGRHPCHDGGGDVRWSDLGRTPPDVREWAPDCPPGVARLLGELLAADPRRRLSGMDDVVARLGAEVG
jgi:hypothetical protein